MAGGATHGGRVKRGVVLVPWYATLFRGDRFEEALAEIAPIALRYGALEYDVLRSHDDTYKFMQLSEWDDKLGWERYWYGPEFARWRAEHSGWFQVPIVYQWNDRVVRAGVRIAEPVEVE
jgi:quinol monooxygenase YgiN